MKSASEFIEFMADIWRGDLSPSVGGVKISGHKDYFKYENAIVTATRFGFSRLWSYRLNGEPGFAFQAPDGSRLAITTHGAACRLIKRHTGKIQ